MESKIKEKENLQIVKYWYSYIDDNYENATQRKIVKEM